MTDTEKAKKTRQIFIVSDGTAITAETLAHSILTQFPDLHYHQTRIPFVNSVEKAVDTARRINAVEREEGLRPIIFTTFVEPDIMRTFNELVSGHIIDLFRKFVGPLETELGMKSEHSIGQTHRIRDDEKYQRRIAAIDYTLQHDDGQTNRGLDEADVILVGVSRSGKTPTSLFLAMQFGIKVANYPLIPEDFDRGTLPEALLPLRSKLFGLSIAPERLSEINGARAAVMRACPIASRRFTTPKISCIVKAFAGSTQRQNRLKKSLRQSCLNWAWTSAKLKTGARRNCCTPHAI